MCIRDRTLTLEKLETSIPEFMKTYTGGFGTPKCETIEVETDGENPQHAGVLRAFAQHLLKGTPLIADGTEGINGLTLSNAMHLSSWLNETVTLPLDADKFLEELNKRRATSRLKDSAGKVLSTCLLYTSRCV